MNPNFAVVSDGKKFMWDGRSFENSEEASQVAEAYQNDSFEVRMVEESGKFLVYTRRAVKEVVVTGQ